jgi:hypothetical protein
LLVAVSRGPAQRTARRPWRERGGRRKLPTRWNSGFGSRRERRDRPSSAITIAGGHFAYDCGLPLCPDRRRDDRRCRFAVALDDERPIGNQNVTFTVQACRATACDCGSGQPVVVDLPDVLQDRLTLALRTYDLGVMPASGAMQYVFHVPGNLPPGFLIVFRRARSLSGETLSASIPMIRR